jgi:hydroxymethylbilane synthase
MRLRIGTRGSQLALWQANLVARTVKEAGGPDCDVVVMTTSGDRLAEARLGDLGGKRLFVKEIEDALLAGTVDLAVHSAKDMPVELPGGLELAGVLPREDPRDVLVLPPDRVSGGTDLAGVVAGLGPTARIATSSVRRVAQLSRLIPGAAFRPIRGNLDTRLRKLDAGEADALILAAAGLRRLGFAHRISATLPVEACTPAPGQGAIAVEIRSGDERAALAARMATDEVTWAALAAERALVARLGGGCQTPIGALAQQVGEELLLHGIVTSLDGSRALRSNARGSLDRPEALGARVADDLVAAGAAEILDEVRRRQSESGTPVPDPRVRP